MLVPWVSLACSLAGHGVLLLLLTPRCSYLEAPPPLIVERLAEAPPRPDHRALAAHHEGEPAAQEAEHPVDPAASGASADLAETPTRDAPPLHGEAPLAEAQPAADEASSELSQAPRDQARPTREQLQDAAQTPEAPEPSTAPEAEPAPEPEAPLAQDPSQDDERTMREVRFIRNPDSGDLQAVPDAEFIAAASHREQEARRAPVLAPTWGEPQPTVDGAPAAPSQARPHHGHPEAPRLPPAAAPAATAPAPAGVVEALEAPRTDLRPPIPAAEVAEAKPDPAREPSTPPAVSTAARAPAAARSPQAASASASPSPLPRDEPPSWWQPLAARMPPAAPVRVALAAPSPAPATAMASPRPPAPPPPAPPPPPQGVDADPLDLPPTEEPEEPREGTPEPRPERPPPIEPVAELREALGWGRPDAERHRPLPASHAAPLGSASPQASHQAVVSDHLPPAARTAIASEATPLGRYTDALYGMLQERWLAQPLDPLVVGAAMDGRVVVRFRVEASGRVRDRAIESSSGSPELDRLALEAVPHRLPRFPRELLLDDVTQRVIFTYRTHVEYENP